MISKKPTIIKEEMEIEYQAMHEVESISPFYKMSYMLADNTLRLVEGTSKLLSKVDLPIKFEDFINNHSGNEKINNQKFEETFKHKHKDIETDDDLCPSETKFTMKMIDAPTTLMLRSSSLFNKRRVQVVFNHTEVVISDGKSPMLILNYTQISKWSIRKDDCIITLHYSKTHYNGEFKYVRLRTNTLNDSEVLNTLVRILEFHIAQLVVHKGMAPDLKSALALFKPKEEVEMEP